MKNENTSTSRRDFLKLAGTSAVAVAVGGESAAAAEESVDSGFSKTVHVRKYLDLARF